MVGLQILARKQKISDRFVQAFASIPVANVSDCMWRMTAGGSRLRPMHDGSRMGGAAITVKSRPGDNLMIHKALDMAEPGDVLVVDAGGDLSNALFGELMLTYAARRKLGGIVLNGAVRDVDVLRGQSLPVYAAGVTHRGPYKDGPGEINVPIAIDGMVIRPGDLILGDADGFLCVPFADAEEVLAASQKKVVLEQQTMKNLAAGTHDTSWVDQRLKQIGCDPTPR
ncbi:MAG: RraA family protein [Ramlibacter sp.]